MITINPNAQASILIDEPTISAGEKYYLSFSRQHYFCTFAVNKRVILKAMQSRAQK